MSRFSMALTAAAASALVAAAVLALPAFGGDSGTDGSPATAPAGFGAFVTCLRAHGLDGAPTAPEELKPWLAGKEATDPNAVKTAMLACRDSQPKPTDHGPGIEEFGACLRSRGLDAPTAPDALKQWVASESGDPSFEDDLRACKMQLDPGKPGATDKKPATCAAAGEPPADKAVRPST
jgi:hypothetical protein